MYRLRVEKDYTGFSAAHFLTFNANKCARLHGHNYRTAVSVQGTVNDEGYVIDFADLKHLVTALCAELDHRVLLPSNPLVVIAERNGATEVSFSGKRYVFPTDEVLLVPVPNTTAECLARWIAERLATALHLTCAGVREIEVEVEESAGQCASYRCDLASYAAHSAPAAHPRTSAAAAMGRT